MNEAAEVFDIEEFREGFRLLAEMTGESDPKPRRRRVVRRKAKVVEPGRRVEGQEGESAMTCSAPRRICWRCRIRLLLRARRDPGAIDQTAIRFVAR